jgi:alanine racemase
LSPTDPTDTPTSQTPGRAPDPAAGEDAPRGDSDGAVRILRPERARPSDIVRPTRADIDLAALRHNLRVVKGAADGAEVWSVLKADGYGHGSKAVGRTLERAGSLGVCVALLEEAVELREAGIRLPILVMGGYYGRAWDAVLRYGLTPVLYDAAHFEELAAEVRFQNAPALDVHLKVDTGMARLGAPPEQVGELAQRLKQLPELRLSGLMTHFACADAADAAAVEHQLDLLDNATREIESAGLPIPSRHAANSAALLKIPRTRMDLVRPGLAIFGIEPSPELCPSLRPVMSVHTRVVATRSLKTGQSVGYGWTWTAKRPSRIATIPIGYADGLARGLSNRGDVLIHGRRCPIVGIVSMDLTMVDVTDITDAAGLDGVELGDECVILGKQEGRFGSDAITAQQIAAQLGTIPWEVLTSVSRRVPRFYRNA